MDKRHLIVAILSALLLVVVLAVRGEEPPQKPQSAPPGMELLMKLSQAQEPADRLALLDQILQEYPEHPFRPQLIMDKGGMLVELDRAPEAIQLLEPELKKAPQTELEIVLSQAYLASNTHLDRAESLLSGALDKVRVFDPAAKPFSEISDEEWQKLHQWQLFGVLSTLAGVQEKQGNPELALATYREALELNQDPGLIVTVADLLEKQGRQDEALKALEELLGQSAVEDQEILDRHERLFLAQGGDQTGLAKRREDLKQSRVKAQADQLKKELVDQPAAAFKVQLLDSEQEVTLESFKGRVLVLNFWATWCGPCRVELPHFQKAFETLGSDQVAFLAVSTDQGAGAAKVPGFVKKQGLTFPVAIAPAVAQAYGVRGIPHMVVIDPNGKIRFIQSGFDPSRDLVETLRAVASLIR